MKNILKKIVFILPIILSGCADKENTGGSYAPGWVSHGGLVYTRMLTIENHSYIILEVYNGGGIVHAESCDCKKVHSVNKGETDE